MGNIVKNPDKTATVILHLSHDEKTQVMRLGKKLNMNEFDVIKYCIRLVAWWSKGEIEPEEE